MDQRRYLLFVLVTMGFFLLWMQVAPVLFPDAFPQPQRPDPDPVAEVREDAQAPEEPERDPALAQAEPDADKPELAEFPNRTLLLGQPGFDNGFLIQAQLNTRGAAVDWVQLTDPRYTTLDRREQLKVVGNEVLRNIGVREVPRTLQTQVAEIDAQLEEFGLSLAEVDWELVRQDAVSATFRFPAPDGRLEVVKTYRLDPADLANRDHSPEGYLLNMELAIRNLSDRPVEAHYSLYGPVGLPLENAENTRLFREAKLGTLDDVAVPDRVTGINMTASDLVSQVEKARKGARPVDTWRDPVHYAGMDVQFFAALVFPDNVARIGNGEGGRESYFALTRPELLFKADKKERSDFTVVMESHPLEIGAGQTVSHRFQAFFGPKRSDLLEPLQAGHVVQLGWFATIAKAMHWVLDLFHHTVGLSYAFAIILLTVVVRGLMIPISRKQVIEAEKMKVLAPKLKEIQEKHKGKPEEFHKAYREFQKKNNYHPLVGCLPALLQLPIFIGLYQALFQAVDLRLAPFLWINNLAAPDALFPLPFQVPWFGWTEFNLLPIVTVALFIVQQKMFTPPPTSEEQVMQYKMMNVMMIVIGFLFYTVPAGLCLYFISSSVWGVGERLVLKRYLPVQKKAEEDLVPDKPVPKAEKPETPDQPRAAGWFGRVLEAADQAKNATDGQGGRRFSKAGKKKKGSKPRR